MKLARVGLIAAAIFAFATVAWAQKPDFSGTWTLDPASAPAAGAGRGGGGSALGTGPATVKQTADALTVERTMGDTKAQAGDGGPGDGVHAGLDTRRERADGGHHQRARHTEAGFQEVVGHSLRRAINGSTRAARRAGTALAISEAMARTRVANAIAAGSCGSTP